MKHLLISLSVVGIGLLGMAGTVSAQTVTCMPLGGGLEQCTGSDGSLATRTPLGGGFSSWSVTPGPRSQTPETLDVWSSVRQGQDIAERNMREYESGQRQSLYELQLQILRDQLAQQRQR